MGMYGRPKTAANFNISQPVVAHPPYQYGAPQPRIQLHHGECLDLLRTIPDHSIDLLLADLPYGTTFNPWDILIPFDQLWPQIERVLKPRGVCLMFGSQPFTAKMIESNPNYFRNIWYWEKTKRTGYLLAGRQPMRCIEEICVFGRKARSATYNPQLVLREKCLRRGTKRYRDNTSKSGPWQNETGRPKIYYYQQPTQFLQFPSVTKCLIPTQKPVDLLRYLIRTYSNAGDVVLDPTAGSGSTGVACLDEHRCFIGFEKDAAMFVKATNRIDEVAHRRVAEKVARADKRKVAKLNWADAYGECMSLGKAAQGNAARHR